MKKLNYDIKEYEVLESTSTTIKELAEQGAKEGCVVIANEQTAGRGRQGRSFFSPKNSGIYMSILLKPKMAPSEAVFITTMAAVAVAEGIREATGAAAGIKWVNDIYAKNRKICGILTEAALSEKGELRYVVLGIGINVSQPKGDFPDDLAHIAGALYESGETERKKRIVDTVLEHFAKIYESFAEKDISKADVAERYRKFSIVLDRDIDIVEQGNDGGTVLTPAHVDEIDDDCRLHVTLENGERRILSSGEVSTRIRA